VTVRHISAVTLAVRDMARAVDFYGAKVGLEVLYGGATASFTSFRVGDGYLNLLLVLPRKDGWTWWGRVIFYVDDVDALYQRLVDVGVTPSTLPEDAPWGERYFHVNDPDGHEVSFARPLKPREPEA
jgi:catechol 2,3-dioxygenase-like lactoylglutathione lyase family enzyme